MQWGKNVLQDRLLDHFNIDETEKVDQEEGAGNVNVSSAQSVYDRACGRVSL